MKHTALLVLFSLGLTSATALAGFTAGNVVVLQCTNTSTGGGGTLVEFNRVSGPTGYQVTLPYANGSDSGTSIVFGNSSTLNHDITLSDDGAFVVLGAYAYSATGVDSAAVPRVMATVKYDGTYARPISVSTTWSVRGAASDGFGNYWFVPGTGGSDAGVIYVGLGGPYAVVQPTTGRAGAVVGGNLYYTVGDGVHAYTGAPTTSVGAGGLVIPFSAMGGSGQSASFAIPTNIVVGAIAYLVDYNTSPNSLGIGHYHWDGGSWVWDYNLAWPAGSPKPQHIAVDYANPSTPVVYVTPAAASANNLYYYVDSGSGSARTPLATAPAGNAFRGLTMAPATPAAPVFTVQPVNQTNYFGTTVSFGPVAATGADPNGFTWTRYGTNLVDGPTRPGGAVISGSHSNTLTVAGIGNDDRTCYYAVAHNNGPTAATSTCAFLGFPPSCINPNLTPVTLCAGTTAHFTGGVSGCVPSLTISWTWNGGFGDVPINDGPGPSGLSTISGATTGSLTISNPQDGDAGVYTLSVLDGNGATSSSGGLLTVADPVGFTQQPSNQDKVGGQTASFTVVASGNAVSYQWNKNGGAISDGPTGSGSTRAGTQAATLWITNVQSADVGTYTCTVSNVCLQTQTSDPATLTVGFVPVFTNLPLSLMATSGLSAVFTGQASGTTPITYTWKHDGVPLSDGPTSWGSTIAGSGSDTLSISGVQANDARTYTVTANNSYGSANASVVLTVVIDFPKPHTVPGLIIYEPFNYPPQAYPGFPAPGGWTNSWQDVVSAWNEVTHQPAVWERFSQAYCTVEDAAYGPGALVNSGQYPWKGIDCVGTRDWYWSSAPNNNHLNFGGVDQTNGAAYFSFVFQVTQGSPLSGNAYDIVAGLTTGTGGANSDNWVYKLCTHSSNGGDSYQLGLFKGGGTTIGASSVNGQWVPQDFGRGGLHLIVGCYKFNHGTNLVSGSLTNDDVLSLWIDPDRSTYGVAEGSVPAPSGGGMVTNWNVNAPITEFALKGLVEPASKRIADLRIGTTWASVTRPYYPTLKIATTTTDVTVSWPAKDTPYNAYNGFYYGYFLQSAPNLTDWANDFTSLVLDGTGTNLTATETLNAPQYFRLKYP